MIEMKIGFIDDSYWDEGNRSTWTTKTFASLEIANDFLSQHLGKPYVFQGQEGDVHSSIDPERLQIQEVTKVTHDWRSLPCFRVQAEENIKGSLRSAIQWGGDLQTLEKQAEKFLSWSRTRFLEEWRGLVIEEAATLSKKI
jgi:hypothetical protein